MGAFSSGGNSPVLTQYLNENARRFLTPELGKLNEFMGQLRPRVKDTSSGFLFAKQKGT